MEFRTVSTRLAIEEFTLVNDYCNRTETNPSALIRELLSEEISPSIPSNVAGRNVIEYDKKKDSFTWRIELDNGERVTALKNISPEYLRELCAAISSALTSRDELQGKKKVSSVPVPKKLLGVRK
jgi:hypothetical protein